MNMNWTDLVNEIQKYKFEPKDLYRLYIEILPKVNNGYDILKEKVMKYREWVVDIVVKYHEVSIKEDLTSI